MCLEAIFSLGSFNGSLNDQPFHSVLDAPGISPRENEVSLDGMDYPCFEETRIHTTSFMVSHSYTVASFQFYRYPITRIVLLETA
jgi:hypothetical protein